MNGISNFIMDHDYQGEESPHKLDQNMVNIKDYSQNQDNEQEQDCPFDQLQLILGQDQNRQSRNQHKQYAKVKQLQQRYSNVKQHNHYLDKKVQQLYFQLQQYEQLTQDDPKEKELIEYIEKQVTQFKKNFQEFRNKQVKINEEKDTEIKRLRQELDRTIEQKNQIEQEKVSLFESNEDLIKNNQSLILQIQKLQNQLVQSRSEINSSRTYRFSTRRDHGFESQVQAELEILIEKLMSQLQLQRNQKRRLNDEIKRMQKETMLLQREITTKNNKIYQLQMNNLKQNRTNKNNQSYQPSKYTKLPKENVTKNDRASPLKNIPLIQLLDGDISDRQRLIISSKIIDFYSRKINSKDYACFQLDNLLVCNYNKPNHNLISIRKDTNAVLPQSTQQKMLYNLGQILDLLLGQYLNQVKQSDSGQEYLLSLINQIFTDKDVNINDIYVIKQLIEDCLKSRK